MVFVPVHVKLSHTATLPSLRAPSGLGDRLCLRLRSDSQDIWGLGLGNLAADLWRAESVEAQVLESDVVGNLSVAMCLSYHLRHILTLSVSFLIYKVGIQVSTSENYSWLE